MNPGLRWSETLLRTLPREDDMPYRNVTFEKWIIGILQGFVFGWK